MAPVLAFLQARTGSRRLPGKVLLRIGGRTILERAIERLRAACSVDDVVVLTTMLQQDDAVVEEAARLGAPVHRGAQLDVLLRFQEAAERYRPDIVVRATADNPLVDVGSVDRIVGAVRGGLDYCMERELPVGAATEAITRAALGRVHALAWDFRHREHVTLYVKEHPEEFRSFLPLPPDPLRRPDLRLTVDTPEDFVFVENLIQGIPEGECPVPLESYLPLAAQLVMGQSPGPRHSASGRWRGPA